MDRQGTLLLTGATGTLGREILKYLMTRTRDRVYALIRSKNGQSHLDRAAKILNARGLGRYLGDRIRILDGDITHAAFGLTDKDLDVLRGGVDHFFHIAANTTLNGTKEQCYRINLNGTENAVALSRDLYERGGLGRFHYFSTAYVAGSKQDYCAGEDVLPENPAHANYYESSKYEAEMCVRQAGRRGLPVTIFRPSIVVGNSVDGEVSQFNVIYPFFKLFAHGILTRLPTRPDRSFNIVPIDFVTDASLTIAFQRDSVGKTYHLVTLSPPTIGMLLDLKKNKYPNLPHIDVVDPEEFDGRDMSPKEQMVFKMLEPYLGYLNDHLTFDARNTIEALEGTGIEMPRTDDRFLEIILKYAFDVGYLVSR